MAGSDVRAILDTLIYLSYLRKGGDLRDSRFLARPTVLYLSSVVFAELNAGAKDRQTVRLLERFYNTFDRSNRVVAPDRQVWFEAAQVCGNLARASVSKKKESRGSRTMF